MKEASNNYQVPLGQANIQAKNKITGSSYVDYRAKSILLEPGFLAETGVVFSAEVGGCFSELTQAQEQQMLDLRFTEIQNLASSISCTNSQDWTFTSYGSKACGGPVGYIAYSNNINTALLLNKIAAHKTAQQAFNTKWNVISDCSITSVPTGVICTNGQAVLQYQF